MQTNHSYKARLRRIVSCVKDRDNDLFALLLNGDLTPPELAKMEPHEMVNAHMKVRP